MPSLVHIVGFPDMTFIHCVGILNAAALCAKHSSPQE